MSDSDIALHNYIDHLKTRIQNLTEVVESAGGWIQQAEVAVEPGWAGSTDHILHEINTILEIENGYGEMCRIKQDW